MDVPGGESLDVECGCMRRWHARRMAKQEERATFKLERQRRGTSTSTNTNTGERERIDNLIACVRVFSFLFYEEDML